LVLLQDAADLPVHHRRSKIGAEEVRL
jgi:hypothetical protein